MKTFDVSSPKSSIFETSTVFRSLQERLEEEYDDRFKTDFEFRITDISKGSAVHKIASDCYLVDILKKLAGP